ncbi:HutD family protein [Bordetella parapertussis]|uniref:HutD family protein n=12 Tax=Bordetella TaxID=517 RepID=K0MM33_BORPB|nr:MULTISPECIES: HutD family protein [Bordetella]KAK66163.1 hypothetical protein AZ22_1063 [Bordetella bronchiseptica 980-2]SHR53716.1 Various environmental stresses-induced protein [Mycobacteroides abscessus subsp. abscessus]AUL42309.1 histidine utilization protein HutD [Bordetella parapertussis]AWP62221.1 histidine utilization protein HutD [Bordetella parapertussis]AWP69721.1 histidine utilization protein HutD [Bordetella parapertussis]
MFQRFELAQLPVSPWRNGGGATREVARHPQGAAADGFEWRVSVADIGADGPFSAYPGIDRSITLLEGAGVRMRSADGTLDHLLDVALRPFAFAGEHAIDATLLGGPSRDFNVMTRRGRWRAEARVLHGQAVLAPAPAGVLFAAGGDWRVQCDAGQALLRAGAGVVWRAAAGAIHATPLGGEGGLIAVRLLEAGATAVAPDA